MNIKAVLFCLMLIGLTGCYSAKYAVIPVEERQITQIYEFENIDQATLLKRASEWFAFTYNSGKSVIQNQTESRIIGRAIETIYVDGGFTDVPVDIRYSIVVDVKDNRARIHFGQYNFTEGGSPEMAVHITPLNKDLSELSERLAQFLKTGSNHSISASDDW